MRYRTFYKATSYTDEVKHYRFIRSCVFDLNLGISEQALKQSLDRKGYWDNEHWHIEKCTFLD